MSDAIAGGPTAAERLIVSTRLWLWVLLGGAALWLVTDIATGLMLAWRGYGRVRAAEGS